MQSLMTVGGTRGKPLWRATIRRGHPGWGRVVSGAGSTNRGGAGGTTDTAQALARLEAAVERLATAAARPRSATGEEVSRAQVQAIADRLDETTARLRVALGEDS